MPLILILCLSFGYHVFASSIFVLFGRPGSGKSTIASSDLLITQLEKNNLLAIDLDICIPQAMKDNFAQGIYPSLQEREDFIVSACDYVEQSIRHSQCRGCLISFSFVNSDIRDIFRSRFPQAQWILVDTSILEADKRISQRKGHFYKNELLAKLEDSSIGDEKNTLQDGMKVTRSSRGEEWEFANVEFDHIRLDGLDDIDRNVKKVIHIIENEVNLL